MDTEEQKPVEQPKPLDPEQSFVFDNYKLGLVELHIGGRVYGFTPEQAEDLAVKLRKSKNRILASRQLAPNPHKKYHHR